MTTSEPAAPETVCTDLPGPYEIGLDPKIARRIKVDPDGGHWFWLNRTLDGPGSHDDDGYPRVWPTHRHHIRLHTLTATAVYGPRPPGKEWSHNEAVCNRRDCCSPYHGAWDTHANNIKGVRWKSLHNPEAVTRSCVPVRTNAWRRIPRDQRPKLSEYLGGA